MQCLKSEFGLLSSTREVRDRWEMDLMVNREF